MNAIPAYPLTTAGGTLSGPLFLADPMPAAPSAVASRAYVDAVIASTPTTAELEALREEVRQLREMVHSLPKGRDEAPGQRAPAPALSSAFATSDYPRSAYSWPYFTPTPILTLDPSGNLTIAGNLVLPGGNVIAEECVSTIASVTTSLQVISGAQWQQQGAWTAWDYGLGGTGLSGETDFINSYGLGTGGFAWYVTASSASATPVCVATLNAAGNLTLPAGNVVAEECVSTVGSVVTALAPISGAQWQQQGAWITWGYQGTSGLNGENDYINSRGAGTGGHAWFTTLSTTGATPTLLAKLDAVGNFTTAGYHAVGAGAATINSGTGAPSTARPAGSLFLRTDGGTGTRLYVSNGSTWTGVAGV